MAPAGGGQLAERYDALFVDLDGVVNRGDEAVPGAAETLKAIRALGTRMLFLTNNSSKTPEQVADKLAMLGIVASGDDVLTSALATAAMLKREGEAGKEAFVIGERGIRDALASAGILIVDGTPERADLVVVGFDRSVDYVRLRTASLLVQRGAKLVATNADASYPARDGLWPGAGAILAAITTTTGALPVIVGKPGRPLFEAAAERTGARNPLVVGDRLDTDVAGATGMGWDSLLVLSGASRPAELLRSDGLPTYLGRDLSVLLQVVPPGRFRPGIPLDLPGLRSLLVDARLSDAGLEDRVGATLVCEADHRKGRELVATACLERVGAFGILRSVAVRERYRAHGLGMLAVAHAVAGARSRGLSHVFLFTDTAGQFFERVGFQPLRWRDLPEPVRTGRHAAEECAQSATPMVFDLPPVS